MPTSFIVFALAALLAGLALWWVLRAFAGAGAGASAASAGTRRAGLVAAAVAAVATIGLYAATGKPNLPDQPYKSRLDALKQTDPTRMSPEQIMAVLAERARQDPRDPRPHIFTGQILAELGRDQEAARAYEAALRRDPMNPEALLGLGRVAVSIQAGAITPEALSLFQAAAMSAPNDPTPWLYQALAATQERRWADALKLWPEVEKRLAPDDPRHAMVASMIAEAKNPPPAEPAPTR
ncbi:MAG: tetratricopeptide repeat protein [Alphaproteobacteria bacterium]|nr:tetratricopeptide repeat protein [Alphaproteobacteria bacterium]